MFQTSYKGIVTLHRNNTYYGGFCKFFYIPVEDILTYPRINAATQTLVDEPSLKPGKHWYGPIHVPKDRLGFTEGMKVSKAGHHYEIKVSGLHTGESVDSRINYENMPFHRYVLVAKVRAGGFYIIIGSVDSWCKFLPEYNSGAGPGDSAGTPFTFATEQINKALGMPSFAADTSAPGDGGNGDEDDDECMVNQKEIIPFEETPSISIPWTAQRLAKFGSYPVVQVWVQDGDDHILSMGGEIVPDAPPPAFTELSVNLGGNPSGFIVLT